MNERPSARLRELLLDSAEQQGWPVVLRWIADELQAEGYVSAPERINDAADVIEGVE